MKFYQYLVDAERAGFRACKRCQPEVGDSPQMRLVREVIAFLVNQYDQKVELKDIVSHVGVSSYYLERLGKNKSR